MSNWSIIVTHSMCRQYLDNIKVVDKGIEHITDMFEDFFNKDGKTAYVFTADHGMTNWGMINSVTAGSFRLMTHETCSMINSVTVGSFSLMTHETCSMINSVTAVSFRLMTHETCSMINSVTVVSFRLITHETCSMINSVTVVSFKLMTHETCSMINSVTVLCGLLQGSHGAGDPSETLTLITVIFSQCVCVVCYKVLMGLVTPVKH